MRIVLAVVVLISLCLPSDAKNLHQYYAGSWDCSYISATLMEKYNACKACEAKGQEYDDEGFCVPKSDSGYKGDTTLRDNLRRELGVSRAQQGATKPKWGALAAGIREGNPSRVSVGSAIRHPTRESAEQAALSQCQSNGVSCRIVGSFTGCGYITTGKNSSRPGVAWGTGPQPIDAYQQCRARVDSCDRDAIGGCSN